MIIEFFQFIAHLDANLLSLANSYGGFLYGILFLIIFCETGLVFTPFLPGDSLLFAAGALSGAGILNVWIIFFSLLFAAILGDSVNYSIGKFAGKKILEKKFLKATYIKKTENFYEKYGNKAIVIARFVPIVRTFAPFIAGVGRMRYSNFFFYNVIGAVIWVCLFVFGGFFFGNFPFVKEHFSWIILGIIFISIIPVILELIKYKFSKN